MKLMTDATTKTANRAGTTNNTLTTIYIRLKLFLAVKISRSILSTVTGKAMEGITKAMEGITKAMIYP